MTDSRSRRSQQLSTGVWPCGAQVRHTTDCSMKPDSWKKTNGSGASNRVFLNGASPASVTKQWLSYPTSVHDVRGSDNSSPIAATVARPRTTGIARQTSVESSRRCGGNVHNSVHHSSLRRSCSKYFSSRSHFLEGNFGCAPGHTLDANASHPPWARVFFIEKRRPESCLRYAQLRTAYFPFPGMLSLSGGAPGDDGQIHCFSLMGHFAEITILVIFQ